MKKSTLLRIVGIGVMLFLLWLLGSMPDEHDDMIIGTMIAFALFYEVLVIHPAKDKEGLNQKDS